MNFHGYDAFLFDLDGTLADSMLLHNQAWIETLKNVGCHITVDTLREFAGVPNERSVEIFNKRFGWTLNPETIAIAKEDRFLQVIDKVGIIEPVHKIAREHYAQKKPMAIVSGGTPDIVGRILRAIKSENLFPVRVCAGDVARGKPAPDPFLHAAKLLKIAPEKCLVFEDGQAGIDGAKAAGMGVVKVAPDFSLSFI
jgi:HAD superfamily hydrolase (TIGR01509 family)